MISDKMSVAATIKKLSETALRTSKENPEGMISKP
jgi:hypothetical protein